MLPVLKTIVIFNLFRINNVLARSDGAPTDEYPGVCDDMIPRGPHTPILSNSRSPFTVDVDKKYFKPGEEIIVTINGSELIKGLLLQGRDKDTGKVIGTFINLPAKLKKASCPNLQV